LRVRRLAFLGVLALTGRAHADGGFLEAHVGLAVPIADDDYENAVDDSLKLGVRIGAGTIERGIDLGIDYTAVNDNLSSALVDFDFSRYRFIVGGRAGSQIGKDVWLFGRLGAGVDLVRYRARGNVLGINFDQRETDAGLALEVSGGLAFRVGPVMLGAAIGVPMAFHFEQDDPGDPRDADLEYTGIDIDFTVFVFVPI
jgi:hypothetical protein